MKECLFCRIAAGDVQANIVAETDDWIAFRDIDPQAPVHVLVIPRRHIERLDHASADDALLMGELIAAAARIAATEGIAQRGFRVVVNTGAEAGQSVAHVHFHVLGGRRLSWPPG